MEADAVDANAINAKVTMSPKAHSELKMVNTASTIKGKADCGTDVSVYPIMLGAPTVGARPDLGDQGDPYNNPTTNFQFLYGSGASLPYVLKVPGEIWLTRDLSDHDSSNTFLRPDAASSSEADWLLHTPDPDPAHSGRIVRSVGFQFDNTVPLGDLLGYTLNPAQGKITVNTAGYSGNNFVFSSLPASNDSFGNHTLTLMVNTDPSHIPEVLNGVSQTAHFQTFYKGTDSTWPNSDGKPNWWHYYNQVFPATGSTDPQNPVYNVSYVPGAGPSHATTDFSGNTSPLHYPIVIQDDAYKAPEPGAGIRIFDISPDVDPDTGTHVIRYIGDLFLGGLPYYTAVVAHERGHVETFVTPDGSGVGNIYTQDQGPYSPQTPNTSHDGDPTRNLPPDHISDAWEQTHHMNPYRPDTTHGLADYGTSTDSNIEDDQILADIASLGGVFTNTGSWNKDWADGGLNFGAPYFVKDIYPVAPGETPRTGQSLVFYMKFRPAVSGAGAQPFQPEQIYQIRNEQDLRSQYPTLLTSIAQLSQP